MILTIDGPAGAGKSSAAKEQARRLGFEYLDTGAMYRAVTLAALRAGINLRDPAAVETVLSGLALAMPPGKVVLNGEDITPLIRTAEVTAASGPIADNHAVRRRLVDLQRAIAAGRDMVCEGRDQGTIVLVADPDERARRRQREMRERGEVLDLAEVLKAQEARDQRDARRDLAPMKPAADALVLDSTHLTLQQVVDRMEQEVRRCTTG